MALTWRRAPKNNGFVAKAPEGEFHVYRAEKGSRKHQATLNGEVIGLWSDAQAAMYDIDWSQTKKAESKASIDAVLERLRPYVSADDVTVADVVALTRVIADRAADDFVFLGRHGVEIDVPMSRQR